MIRTRPRVTELIESWRDGDDDAGRVVLSLVYDELRRLARHYLRNERAGHTLEPTALVHEAYVRLVGADAPPVESRVHLIGAAARLMRQILVNHALGRRTLRRGGDRRRVPLDPSLALFESRCLDLVALDEALERLAARDPRQARVVELRFFGGLTMEETAVLLQAGQRSIERDWTMARAWLRKEMTPR